MTMKVLVLNPRSITHSKAGGAEIFTHEILTHLSLKGFQIFVISTSDQRRNIKTKYIEYIASRFEILFPILSIKYIRFIKKVDLIIENISKFPLLWPLFISKILAKPFVAIIYHIHGESLFRELPFPIALMLYIYEKFSLKLYSYFRFFIITVSESTKKELISFGFPSHNILLVEVGLDSELKNLCNSIAKNDKPLIVYVGRLKKYKRVDHLIDSLKIVVQKIPNVECIIAGKGDKKVYEELKEKAKKLGLEKNIKFIGEINTKTKIEILSKAWVYVMTSMKEGFGISALEAQACGTPVVGYKVPGLVDCVKNNITGILVADGNVEALSNAILRLLLDETLRLKMMANARNYAMSFDWEKSADKIFNFLKKIIE